MLLSQIKVVWTVMGFFHRISIKNSCQCVKENYLFKYSVINKSLSEKEIIAIILNQCTSFKFKLSKIII